ncbi:MAG TPA: sensor histidine kinase [Bacteroidetes bacterium]|nr:sensor histidine kinase [Bacteroidota bacterium]
MMLTFALFVGGAVVGIGLYSFLVLRGQIYEAARETLRQQAERFALQLEAQPDAERMVLAGEQIARVTELGVHIATRDEVIGSFGNTPEAGSFFEQDEVVQALADGFGYDEREVDGDTRLFVAVFRPETDMLIRLAEPEPPLYRAVQKVQAVLAVGMALALLLALIGAWIASRQVVGPLRTITRSAEKIAEGDLDHSIHVRTRTKEFSALTRSLNRMASHFRSDIEELRRVQRVQSEFIGNVSHEVKNPIFAVFGYLEALASDNLPAEQRKRYAQKGLANLTRLNNLFSDLIEIAKLEYREDMVRPEPFDLQELIAEIGEMLEPKAEEKGLELSFENAPLEVYADRNRIRQVLTNLIDNAIAYTDEGSVRCRMRRHMDKARVEVVDTGRGIGQEHLDRIFERFYRVDTARSRKMGGTGLGLAITRQILEAHGTEPHVESTKGRGSRFWFELSLADSASGDGLGAEPEVAQVVG